MIYENHEDISMKLESHEKQIRKLELSDIKLKSDIDHLIARMDNLVETLEKFMDKVGTFTMKFLAFVGITGFGFIIWYIQSH
jgi:phosphoribosylaminoimidazole-succinocarboxamide synthase